MHSPFLVLFLNLGGGEIALVVILILVFFGADKLPEMARAFGKGMREMKNATAEIQREIENGAVEIQRDLNIGEEISELKKATDKITGGIKEGLNTIEAHHNPQTEIASTEDDPKPEPENPLTPPDAIKRD
ncbi:MAG: twin-arginine translocase TatA/TatE family subunit [Bacteroidia bacterium]